MEDGTIVPDKPLAQVLAEAKQAKEDAFQAVWKSMKTGATPDLSWTGRGRAQRMEGGRWWEEVV